MEADNRGIEVTACASGALPMRERGPLLRAWATWFGKPARQPAVERASAPGTDRLGFKRDYEALVHDCWERYGIDPSAYRVEAVVVGSSHGKQIYVVLITGSREDSCTALQLQVLAPVIERRLAETVQARWLGDHTVFAGIWTHWPAHVRQPDELRTAMASLRKDNGFESAGGARTAAYGGAA